jgi:arylsulfatase A-like enzyme
VCHLPVTALDVFATACALAGIKPETTHPLDSKDMLPVLAGKSKQATHRTLYWHFGSARAVADGDLKLVLSKDSAPQLFDLALDGSEKNDLAAQRPEAVSRLKALLEQWQTRNVKPLWGTGSGIQSDRNAR